MDIDDTHWHDALRWRLGLPDHVGTSQNAPCKGRALCLDEHANHALNCMTGPVREAVNAGLTDILSEFIEESSAKARERHSSDSSSEGADQHGQQRRRQQTVHQEKEAFLEVWGWG